MFLLLSTYMCTRAKTQTPTQTMPGEDGSIGAERFGKQSLLE